MYSADFSRTHVNKFNKRKVPSDEGTVFNPRTGCPAAGRSAPAH